MKCLALNINVYTDHIRMLMVYVRVHTHVFSNHDNLMHVSETKQFKL